MLAWSKGDCKVAPNSLASCLSSANCFASSSALACSTAASLAARTYRAVAPQVGHLCQTCSTCGQENDLSPCAAARSPTEPAQPLMVVVHQHPAAQVHKMVIKAKRGACLATFQSSPSAAKLPGSSAGPVHALKQRPCCL